MSSSIQQKLLSAVVSTSLVVSLCPSLAWAAPEEAQDQGEIAVASVNEPAAQEDLATAWSEDAPEAALEAAPEAASEQDAAIAADSQDQEDPEAAPAESSAGLGTLNVGDTEPIPGPDPKPGVVYDLSTATIELEKTTVSYTGSAVKAKVAHVMLDGKLVLDDYYTVSYKNNVKPGTATVTVTGTGDEVNGGYVGSASATFEIKKKVVVATETTGYTIISGSSRKCVKENSGYVGVGTGTITDRQAIVKNAYLSGLSIKNNCKNITGSIKYRVNQRGKGWTSWKTGSVAGSSTRGYAVQAIQVKLTGDLAKEYDVYYRVNMFGCDWMGWAKNGGQSGVTSAGPLCIRKLQVKLCKKGDAPSDDGAVPAKATSSTKDAYCKAVLYQKIKNKSSKSKYCISVNTEFNRIAVYKGSQGNWKLAKYWRCTTGASNENNATSHATFSMTGKKGLSFGENEGHSCWYWTQIYGGVRFHSVIYYPYSKSRFIDSTLGERRSNGCIRLDITCAKWIYDNAGKATVVIS